MTTTITTQVITTDHTLSVDTTAQTLGIKPATVRRYLTAGKLTRTDGGVSANSVDAYKARRTAGQAKFAAYRFRKATNLAVLSDVELAAEAWAEAARLEALARDLKAQARPVLEAAGAGQHGVYDVRFTKGRTMQDNEAIKAHYAEIGVEVPTKQAAGSIKVTRLAG